MIMMILMMIILIVIVIAIMIMMIKTILIAIVMINIPLQPGGFSSGCATACFSIVKDSLFPSSKL